MLDDSVTDTSPSCRKLLLTPVEQVLLGDQNVICLKDTATVAEALKVTWLGAHYQKHCTAALHCECCNTPSYGQSDGNELRTGLAAFPRAQSAGGERMRLRY